MKKKIENIIADAKFIKENEPQIEFQLTTIQKIYKRTLDHLIEKPHKLGNFNVIIIITKGKGIHNVDFVPYSYEVGSVFFISKDQIHNFTINPESDGYILAFTDSFLNRIIVNEKLNILYEMFDYHYYPAKMDFEGDSYLDIIELFKIIEKEFSFKLDEFKELILQALLQSTLVKFARKRLIEKIPFNSKDKSLYLRFKKLTLNHNYTMQVNDYAKLLEVSSKTLTNMTNKYLGKSTKKHLDTQLILQIKRLLLDENLTIENISDKLYFDEPTNMLKFFKRLENITPSEFKKQHTF